MLDDERLVTGEIINESEKLQDQLLLRPRLLKDYIGQEKLKSELSVYLKAANLRGEALDHTLIYGPPGLGKTTLAMIIANELEVGIKTTSGPAIERSGDLLALLNELNPGDVLFIDEIHRLPKVIEEVLYSAMEDFYVDIVIGQGATSQPIHFELPPFTLVGATTRAGMLSKPLRDRFGIVSHLEYYSPLELQTLVTRNAEVFQAEIDEEGAYEIAVRSRGTPRIANRLLKRVRDFAQVKSDGIINQFITEESLSILEIDEYGLDNTDRKLLTTMIELYQGGPVGLNTIAVNISEDIETVVDMYEPFLLQNGFIRRTPRGRVATKKAYDHLGYNWMELKEVKDVNN
ncbi:Holliday junction branch migration DNA helicase RuvB [Aerococcaceae bacterium WGS1372]